MATQNFSSATPEFDYQADVFNSSKYNVDGYMYPADLESSRYGGNKVVFYINVSVDSKVLRPGSELATVDDVQNRMRGDLIGEQVGATPAQTAAAIAATTLVTTVGGGALGSLFGLGSAGAIPGLATGATATYLASSTNNQEASAATPRAPTFARPQKRLKTAIALYIPHALNIRYSVGWGEEETFALSAFGQAAQKGEEAVRAMFSDMANASTGSSQVSAGGLAGGVLGNLGIRNAPMGEQFGIATGVAANPKKEQAFKNVDFRTFMMDYDFAPRDAAEAANVLNIIKAFKYHMHPEFKEGSAKFLYVYPSEFDVVYYHGQRENLNIHRHTSCVLTELQVNYSPNGVFSTFPNGMPTHIRVSMTFRELQLLSKETIEKYT